MNFDEDVFVSNDLEFFGIEYTLSKSITNDFEFHIFHNPNVNLRSFHVNLMNFLNICQTDTHDSLFYIFKIAMLYDKQKYTNMKSIPRLSRKQRAYCEYLQKVHTPFEKLKVSANIKHQWEIKHPSVLIHTIPEYMKYIHSVYPEFHSRKVQPIVQQFQLALVFGYPIILGMCDNNKTLPGLIIGFDDTSFFLKYHDHNSDFVKVPFHHLIQSCFDPHILYSISGCNREINLGFFDR